MSAASSNQCCSQTTLLPGSLVALCACSYCRKVRNAATGCSGAQQSPLLLLYCLLQLLVSSHHTQSSQRSCKSGPWRGIIPASFSMHAGNNISSRLFDVVDCCHTMTPILYHVFVGVSHNSTHSHGRSCLWGHVGYSSVAWRTLPGSR